MPKTKVRPFFVESFALCNYFWFRVVGVVRGPFILLFGINRHWINHG
jgi:hypothetical protein